MGSLCESERTRWPRPRLVQLVRGSHRFGGYGGCLGHCKNGGRVLDGRQLGGVDAALVVLLRAGCAEKTRFDQAGRLVDPRSIHRYRLGAWLSDAQWPPELKRYDRFFLPSAPFKLWAGDAMGLVVAHPPVPSQCFLEIGDEVSDFGWDQLGRGKYRIHFLSR